MRIAYISLHWPRTKTSGVGQKIARQISAWENAGNEVALFMHAHPAEERSNLLQSRVFYYRRHPKWILLPLQEISRMKALISMIKAIEDYQPDLIYFRWGMYVYPLHRLFNLAPVIVEINTDDINQYQLLGKIYAAYNTLTRGMILNKGAGIIYTSKELSENATFLVFEKPYQIVTNGIDLTRYQPLSAPQTRIPHLVFIGSPSMPWQGVEKLIDLAKLIPDIHIDVIGYDFIPTDRLIPQNITLHGYLSQKEYICILENATAAIGTLSLHKKGMNEASPLKIRECAAYGIPLILPYLDSDLEKYPGSEVLTIPNTERNILDNADQIRDFIFSMQGKRLNRKFLERSIDSEEKEETRLRFFHQLVKNNHLLDSAA